MYPWAISQSWIVFLKTKPNPKLREKGLACRHHYTAPRLLGLAKVNTPVDSTHCETTLLISCFINPYRYQSDGREWRWVSQTCLRGAQWQDKRQWPQIKRNEIQSEHKLNLYYEGGQTLQQVARRALQSLSVDIVKTQLDTCPGNLLQLTLLQQGLDYMISGSFLPKQFCNTSQYKMCYFFTLLNDASKEKYIQTTFWSILT